MAQILPLKAWRYNPEHAGDIEGLAAPLFDVVSPRQLEALYQNPLNSIHLSVPRQELPLESTAALLDQWKKDKILIQDPLPGIYVYYQYFTLPGNKKEFCRKGFIANLRVTDWAEGDLMRHENTIPIAVNDRVALLEQLEMNTSPTHGLYTDPDFSLEPFMDESMKNPIYDTEDYQGTRDVLSVIQDREVIEKFIKVIASQKIILADGHHRYEGSLIYRNRRISEGASPSSHEGFQYHMMFFTNTESEDLRILPTHRVITGLEGLDKTTLLNALENDFIIKHVPDVHDLNHIILGKKWAFGLILEDDSYKIRLKPEKVNENPWNFPPEIKDLDLTVMHYFVIEKALGIKGKDQRSSPHVSFERSFSACLEQVRDGKAQMALITQEISMEEVKRVCSSGYTLPQKSTYFYPKVIGGFLFSSIKNGEFHGQVDPC